MCPYYNKDGQYCKIYKTKQNDCNENAYCKECNYSYTDCPNYKQLEKTYNGNPKPPYYF